MWHLQDLLGIGGALAVVFFVLVRGTVLDERSRLSRALTMPARIMKKEHR